MEMTFDLDDPGLLLSERVLADPYPLYDVLRRDAPVWRIPGQDSYLVSDPALIREVVARPAEFSSNLVSVLHQVEKTPNGWPCLVRSQTAASFRGSTRKPLSSKASLAAFSAAVKFTSAQPPGSVPPAAVSGLAY